MKEVVLTPEIRQALTELINDLFLKYGLIGLIAAGRRIKGSGK